jgi:N-acetylmuramoyl-L-alanine amidase
MTFLLYLGKVMLCSGILLGYYWLFLRNRRFHHYNRFYLQATLLLSVILPFFRIPVWHSPQSAVSQAVYETLEVLTVDRGEEEVLTGGPGAISKLLTLENGLYVLYGVGIVVLLWVLVRSLLYIKRISKQYPFERIGDLKFFTTREPGTPFSFFRSIFWNNDLAFNSHDGQQIFRHELFHVEQKHSTDIILTEIVTAFFWYNPFFHLLKKELKAIHEFLADQYAISNNDRYAYAELLVLQTLKANHIPITNYFFQNHIKRRISMITHNQRTRYSYRSRLMALPVLALVFCSIALYAQRSTNSVNSVTPVFHPGSAKKPITVVIDAGHGGYDNGATSADGRYLEKNLALEISKKIQQLAPSYNVNVEMTRTDDNLPGNATTIREGLVARTDFAKQKNADLFVAIHVSATGEPTTTQSGFEIYVSRNENNNIKQSRQFGAAVVQELSKIYATNTVLLQRESKGIWVLEQSPCPALVIECGFITNDKDVAFFSNSSNQEAVANKILEGIVNYKNKPVAAVSTPAATAQPVAQAAPVKKPVPVTTPAVPVTPASMDLPVAQNQPVATTALLTENKAAQEPDPMIAKLSRHFNRNSRYPSKLLNGYAEGVVYFSVAVDKNGDISNLQFYDEVPAKAFPLIKLTTVGFTATPTNEQISAEESKKLLREEVKRVMEKKPDQSNSTPQAEQYFFRTEWIIEKDNRKTV